MPKVLIVTDADCDRAITACMVSAFKQAARGSSADVEVITGLELWQKLREGTMQLDGRLLCPLSLDMPESLSFAQQSLFLACRDVMTLRQQVEDKFQSATGAGEFWLPIVLTAKGPLYAEAIATDSTPIGYLQPFHLHDRWRQPLYSLGHRLLKFLSATPATYLMQFGFCEDAIVFDRLFPFPAAPAVASLKVQSPDLFTCHWHCLNRIPLLDLTISPLNH